MEIFRVSRDVYGREVLQGMSWDLIWVFFGLGVAFVVIHATYRWLFAPAEGAVADSAPEDSAPADTSH